MTGPEASSCAPAVPLLSSNCTMKTHAETSSRSRGYSDNDARKGAVDMCGLPQASNNVNICFSRLLGAKMCEERHCSDSSHGAVTYLVTLINSYAGSI